MGDSRAMFLADSGELVDLTGDQVRKPLLGSGSARAVPLSFSLEPGTLLLCSDGLHNYANHQKLVARLADPASDNLARDLADLARLPSGGLQDDLSLIVVRCQS